jgi:3-oxoacyl-[acyl-carrier protein] reductase
MIDPGLHGETVLVTGTNNPEGMGAGISRTLAAQGARVFMTFRRALLNSQDQTGSGDIPPDPGFERYAWLQTKGAEALVREIREGGGAAGAMEVDLSDPEAIPELFDRAEEDLGPVRIVVNCAAHWTPDTFLSGEGRPTVSTESHDRHMVVNSRAFTLLLAEFAQRYVDRGGDWGRVIQISSDGSSGHAGAVSYGASKHATESLARAAAWELGPLGITVNVISPGPVQTGWLSPKMETSLSAQIPLRRVGMPDDVANAVMFLASQQAAWITGQVLYVGGGNVMPL